jgi:hypothetical protein
MMGLEEVGMYQSEYLFAVSNQRCGQMLSFVAWTPTKDHEEWAVSNMRSM